MAKVSGKVARETSTVDQLPRPAQPVILYEFEASQMDDLLAACCICSLLAAHPSMEQALWWLPWRCTCIPFMPSCSLDHPAPPALQGCPYCRKVREAVSILDLDVLFKAGSG